MFWSVLHIEDDEPGDDVEEHPGEGLQYGDEDGLAEFEGECEVQEAGAEKG